ncbi:XRE family transcriptional regulator [Streptomyces malaysiensis]|uniref:XRE family transcriptional regulator n=1 Tax=Streptomyces malaysiensis TaxID=92644 RepID=UPI0011CE3E0E|nr:XRE family transcriptional regulator [Streptomyces malaysiensis]
MGNQALPMALDDAGLTQEKLAEAVNKAIERVTGRPGRIGDRVVRRWLSGQTRWPHELQRRALTMTLGRAPVELGFIPPPGRLPVAPPEDNVNRRQALATGVALGAAVTAPAPATPYRVGMGDVRALQGRFARLIAADHKKGGDKQTEAAALALADEAVALRQRGSCSQRVRHALYATAAACVSSAMWAATDGRRFDAALRHHERAASLAQESGDQTILFRVWSHKGSLYRHLGRPADALDANDVARRLSITRRDPLFASLGHARHAAILGLTRDKAGVDRALGCAREAMVRADPRERRPLWLTAFYDEAEVHSLATTAYLAAGRGAEAEAHAHASLTLFRPHLVRSRAITTARLARAQLGQGEAERAVVTAGSIDVEHPRVRSMLDSFSRDLRRISPGPVYDLWEQRWRTA